LSPNKLGNVLVEGVARAIVPSEPSDVTAAALTTFFNAAIAEVLLSNALAILSEGINLCEGCYCLGRPDEAPAMALGSLGPSKKLALR
jgi:hypothetical protein